MFVWSFVNIPRWFLPQGLDGDSASGCYHGRDSTEGGQKLVPAIRHKTRRVTILS